MAVVGEPSADGVPPSGSGTPVQAGHPPIPEVAARVLDVVDGVPPGEVVTYGEVARAAGLASARQVGQVMSRYGHETCWHRVVHAEGWLPVAVQAEAERRLLAEGVPVQVVGARRRVRLEPGGRTAR